ncbi:MAG: Arc family DNA-binding protein [Deltaproteobacteria bacterium]|nr:Arc family DNA-binding protein [Deltaproteobacteria bacterium]
MNLSIKNAPDDIVSRLRDRAERNHRSLQGELLAILEEAVGKDRALSVDDVLQEISRLGLSTESESADLIRADRDAR